jgi:very-short-patch-repair endonuclease
MYQQMNDTDKIKLIKKLYVQEKQSFGEIAKAHGTYANKVRRDAIKFKLPIRNKSEAQKNVLQSGKSKHPTKGKKRSDSEKDKISLSMHSSWNNLSDKERKKRKQDSKKRWNDMDDKTKENMQHAAHVAIRRSSVEGSKLEKFLLAKLLENNYKTQFHKEQILANTKLQIDIFLPQHNIAIEVDGPSHFEPVWGTNALNRNQKYDQKKTGLILGKGMKLIRIKQTGDYSKAKAIILSNKLMKLLDNISDSKEQLFYIEDNND